MGQVGEDVPGLLPPAFSLPAPPRLAGTLAILPHRVLSSAPRRVLVVAVAAAAAVVVVVVVVAGCRGGGSRERKSSDGGRAQPHVLLSHTFCPGREDMILL